MRRTASLVWTQGRRPRDADNLAAIRMHLQHITYMQQVADISMGKQWKNADIPVLMIYSTSDPATSTGESRYLADPPSCNFSGQLCLCWARLCRILTYSLWGFIPGKCGKA